VAYDVLSDPSSRASYDATLGSAIESEQAPVGDRNATGDKSPPRAEDREAEAWSRKYVDALKLYVLAYSKRRTRSRIWHLTARLIIGLIAIIVSMAVVFPQTNENNTLETELSSSARAYAEAIVAFQHDHNRTPLIGTKDWPNALNGPLDYNGTPYMKAVPKFVSNHWFQVVVRAELAGSPIDGYYIVYIPPRRTFSPKTGAYVYQGYLLRIEVPYWWSDSHDCQASGDPVQVLCE